MHKIKQIRKDLKLTQRQLAAELGLAKNGDVYIRKVEAWNEVLGSVMTYEQFCEDLYHALRGEK